MNEDSTVPSIGISLQMGIGKDATLVFQTHVPQTESAGFMNATLDKLREAAYRQQCKYDLEATEFQLTHDTRILEQLSADFTSIELRENDQRDEFVRSGRRGEWKRDERQQKHRDEMITQMKHLAIQIKAVEQRISELKQKAA